MLRIKTDINGKLELKEESVKVAKGMLTVSGKEGTTISICTADIDKAFIEEGLGIGKLVVKRKDGSEQEVAYFTKSKVKGFRKFSDALNQYVTKNKMISTSFEEEKPKRSSINTLYWLYGFAAKHRRLLAIGVVLSLITVALNLIPPYLLKVLIDSVILSQTHPEALFEELTIILVASYAASSVVQTIQSYALNIAGNRIVTGMRETLFRHAIKLPASDIDNISPSRIQSRLTTDAGNTQWLMTYGLSTVITNALTIIGIGVILFLLFPSLALYVLIPIPFIIVLIISYNKRSDRAYHKSWRRSADLTTRINDTIPNYTVIKSATREDFEGDEFGSGLGKYYDTQVDITKMELKYWQPIGFLVALAAVVIWWVGGNLVIAGTLQLGVITAFLAYMGMFYGPIQQISTIMPYVQESITSGERLREVFDNKDTTKEPQGTKRPDLKGDITFDKVWFGYDPLFPVIKGLSAKIRKGKITSVVGKSGAGKSTVTKLLLGLYRIDSGDIRFGRTSISDIDLTYLRDRISYVPQDSTFFDNTITYNMSYFTNNKINPLDIIATSKAVEMHDEIMKFPLCYDNRIRGRGMSLSGGQRQRLAIARAILGSPDIVLLDEITANLDAINARKVNKAILKLESDKTMIFITHDMTEIINSDFTIVLEDGVIAEQGRPSDLIKKRGRLYKMFKYKMTSKSRPSTKNGLDSYVRNFVVDESKLKIIEGERKSFVDVTYNGKTTKRLMPKRPFPIADPGFIIFYGKGSKDMFAILDYSKLQQASRDILENAIEVNNFNPKVTSISDIRITGDGLEWKLKTVRGDMTFVTKNRNDIVARNDYIILIDEFNTPLKINIKDLDPPSVKLLEMSV